MVERYIHAQMLCGFREGSIVQGKEKRKFSISENSKKSLLKKLSNFTYRKIDLAVSLERYFKLIENKKKMSKLSYVM